MRLALLPALLTVIVLAGCGAASNAQTAASVHATLTRKLLLHRYEGVPDSFTLPIGSPDKPLVPVPQPGECTIDQVVVGETAVTYGDTRTLVHGNVRVTVGDWDGNDESACQRAVRKALGWP
jgi:hypothetical protein